MDAEPNISVTGCIPHAYPRTEKEAHEKGRIQAYQTQTTSLISYLCGCQVCFATNCPSGPVHARMNVTYAYRLLPPATKGAIQSRSKKETPQRFFHNLLSCHVCYASIFLMNYNRYRFVHCGCLSWYAVVMVQRIPTPTLWLVCLLLFD